MEKLDWQALWETRQLSKLVAALRSDTSDETALDRAAFLARAAGAGAATLVEGVAAAKAMGDADPQSSNAALCQIFRAGASAGATAWALKSLEDRFADGGDDGAELAQEILDDASLLRDQLNSGIVVGQDRQYWQLVSTLENEKPLEAAGKLEALLDERPSWQQPSDYAQLASLWASAQDYERASKAWAYCKATWPDADGFGSREIEHALCLCVLGDVSTAIASLVSLRDNDRDNEHGTDAASQAARSSARALIVELERPRASDEPRWSRSKNEFKLNRPQRDSGLAARAVALSAANPGEVIGQPVLASIDSLAALRFELENQGLMVWRLAVSQDVIASCLESGATIILGEERPLGTGFAAVVGIERNLDLLEIVGDERPGVVLRSVADQWNRSAFHGRSALVVLGSEAQAPAVATYLQDRGIGHDERFDLIDACDLDETGHKPHGARVEGLTQLAVEQSPEVPKCWQRRGSALLALLQRGDLEDDDDGDFQRWYGRARSQFEEAEWAHQLIAEALEYQDRHDEAGIAWSDAARIDGEDFRNYLGMARVRAATGLTAAAEASINRALVLEPSSVAAWSLSARLALARDDHQNAKLAAELAVSLAPSDSDVHAVLALVHEQLDERAAAVECLKQAHELAPSSPAPLSRLVRHYIHRGAWEQADQSVRKLIESSPGYSANWTLGCQVAFASGDIEKSLAIATQGVEVVGPYSDLVSALSKSFSALSADPDRAAALIPLLAGSDEAPYDLASALIEENAFDAALAIYESLRKAEPDSVNPMWRQARALLRRSSLAGELDPECLPLLLDVCERAGPFPYPRVLASWLLLNDDPERALGLLSNIDGERDPAIVWSVLHPVLVATDRADDAAEIEARLQRLGDEAVLAAARSLADFGRPDDALRVIEDSEWLSDSYAKSISRAIVHNEARDYAAVTSSVERALEHDNSASAGRFAASAAFRSGAWSMALEWLEPICTDLGRESGSRFIEPWSFQAMRAVAAKLSGNEKALESVLTVASTHPDVVRALVVGEAISGRPLQSGAAESLAAVAPAWHANTKTISKREANS